MRLCSSEAFITEHESKMVYVGFMKSPRNWFPLCVVSDPETVGKLDTLLVSPSYQLMDETVKQYAQQVSQVEDTFVQYLTIEEIQNLSAKYGLDNIAWLEPELGMEGACGCGCGCS
jgi:hypothetical protein